MAKTLDFLVRERAHAIWEREGRPEGEAEAHWLQAVEELRRRPRLPGWSPEHSCTPHARRRDWVVLPRRRARSPAPRMS